MPNTPYTLRFDSPTATLDRAGGKGANLARLSQAGLPVPPGFLIATAAYHAFVQANNLQPRILELARTARADAPASLEDASRAIRELFDQSTIPEDIAVAIRQAYRDLAHALQSQPNPQVGELLATIDPPTPTFNPSINPLQQSPSVDRPPVAVRSSATAEDLPEASFAGQQDTYLNVVGEDALLEAVHRCWSSLWTARAIGYRVRNHIPPEDVALAIVVQLMAPAAASGVLFTADPLTENRYRIVIDATLGLGEALVSGQVEPDHYVYDRRARRIIDRQLGQKAIAIRPKVGGGTEVVQEDTADQPALPDVAIHALAQLGEKVEGLFGTPQDIEWAWDGDVAHLAGLSLLQSRPITSLFPLPQPEPHHFAVYFSLAAVQGMLEPFTPLGADVMRRLLKGIIDGAQPPARRDPQSQPLRPAAGRLFVDVSGLLGDPRGRKLLLSAAGVIEPAMVPAFEQLADDPRLQPRTTLDNAQIRYFARTIAGALPRLAITVCHPDRERERLLRWLDGHLAGIQQQIAAAPDLGTLLQRMDRIAYRGLIGMAGQVLPRVVVGVGAMNLARILVRRWLDDACTEPGRSESLGLELVRGLPHNPTTEMDLALWHLAQHIRQDRASDSIVRSQPTEVLETAYLRGALPAPAQQGMAAFLEHYGARGVGEIDIGRPRWEEHPAPLFEVLQGYLRLEDADQSPEAVFRRGAQAADETLRTLQAHLRRQPGPGWLKARLLGFLYRRIRALAGFRELPKFAMVRTMGALRRRLLAEAEALVEAGVLKQADDIFFVHLSQWQAYARGELSLDALRDIIAVNRDAYEREMRRPRVPRVLTSDGDAFYAGIVGEADGDTLVGSPVSPGVVEGPARVVLDPHNAGLQPGEILVCPATDPGWTPLFLTVAGLVMEMGGMMTHGSVVAREYGIPAVVGVHHATQRLTTGQRVRVDGSTGRVMILDTSPLDFQGTLVVNYNAES